MNWVFALAILIIVVYGVTWGIDTTLHYWDSQGSRKRKQ